MYGLLHSSKRKVILYSSVKVNINKGYNDWMTIVYRDIEYGSHERQKLDIYLPKHVPKSTIIFWHGGSWLSGDKSSYNLFAKSLTKLGVAVVATNYRLFTDARWNTIIEDGARATAWVQNNIQDYGVETQNIIAMGHSAGAYIAAMLVLEKTYLSKAKVKSNNIKGFIGLSGPYDFDPRKKLRPIFDIKDKLKKWLPISYPGQIHIPVLLLHGRFDRFVPPRNSKRLAKALEQNGCKVVLKIYPTLEHLMILPAVVRGFRWLAPVRRDIKRFLVDNNLVQ